LDAAIKNYEGVEVVEDKMVCHCYDVHLSDIKHAISEGVTTLDELSKKTGAGMGCKKCKNVVEKILTEELNSAQ
jgi:NAD(P)H-nitrite reductase large subunit